MQWADNQQLNPSMSVVGKNSWKWYLIIKQLQTHDESKITAKNLFLFNSVVKFAKTEPPIFEPMEIQHIFGVA